MEELFWKEKLENILKKKMDSKAIKKIMKKLDIEKEYSVYELSDPFEFANKGAKEVDSKIVNGWAPAQFSEKNIKVLHGDLEKGLDYIYSYSSLGEILTSEKKVEEPDFSLNNSQVTLLESLSNDKGYSYEIVVYSPKEKYNYDKYKELILDMNLEKALEKDSKLDKEIEKKEKILSNTKELSNIKEERD